MIRGETLFAPYEADDPSQETCSVSVIDPGALDVQTLADWKSLAETAEQPNPFFAPWFLQPAMKWLDPENAVRLLLIHDNGTGKLTGLIPITPGATYARLPIKHVSVWKNNHIYCGTPLIRAGYARATLEALVDWIGTCPMGIRFVRMTQLSTDGPVYRGLMEVCAERERQTFIQSQFQRAVLRQGHDAERLIEASQSTKQRAELRRRIRRFDETGMVEVDETTLSPTDAKTQSECFIRMENAGWKKTDDEGFALAKSKADQAFFRDIMQRGADEGRIISTVLSRDDDAVAISYSLRAQDTLFGFKTAFEREHFKFSPGVRIFHETTRRMLANPEYALYDSCAMPDHPVLDKLWPDRQEMVQINIPARGARNAHILRFAANTESAKERLTKMWA